MSANGNANWRQVFLAIVLALIAGGPAFIMAWKANDKAADTHTLINSRMTELLKAEIAKAIAEATLKEKAGEKARQGAAAEAELNQLPNRIDRGKKP